MPRPHLLPSLLWLAVSSAACGTTPPAEPGVTTRQGAAQDGGRQTGELLVGELPEGWAALDARQARLDGTRLMVEVQHAGGCREHRYGLHWTGAFTKSLPPQVVLTPVYTPNDDTCEALLTPEVTVDLASAPDSWRAMQPLLVRVRGVEQAFHLSLP